MTLPAIVRLAEIPAHDWYKRRFADDIRTISRFQRVAYALKRSLCTEV